MNCECCKKIADPQTADILGLDLSKVNIPQGFQLPQTFNLPQILKSSSHLQEKYGKEKKLLNSVLYEQIVLGNERIVSSDYPLIQPLSLQAADDFVVPTDQIWLINTIVAPGVFVPFAPTGPIPILNGINVFIYADNSGQPGTAIYQFLNYNNFVNDNGILIIFLPNIQIDSGHYWLSVQPVIQNFYLWGWRRTPILTNNPAMIRGNILSKCGPNWGTIADCSQAGPGTEPDLMFVIIGDKVSPPCVHPETKVLLANGAMIPIKDIKAGDKVINRLGEEVEIIYNMKFEPRVRDFIEIPKPLLNVTENLLIRKKHPVWWRNQEILAKDLPKYTKNLVKEVSIDEPVCVYSLCTKKRSFVMMNNLPVCTWRQKEWEKKSKTMKVKYTKQ